MGNKLVDAHIIDGRIGDGGRETSLQRALIFTVQHLNTSYASACYHLMRAVPLLAHARNFWWHLEFGPSFRLCRRLVQEGSLSAAF